MGNKLKLNDLKVGMIVGFDQLTDIYDTWILCTVEDTSKPFGTIQYIGNNQEDERYMRVFSMGKAIAPIYNSSELLNGEVTYDE
jgi:hypothetical protein